MRLSPFLPRTSEYCEVYNWSLWQNWLLADMYAPDHIQEYSAVRTACAVFDVSPIPKYHITVADAIPFLNRIVTQDVSRCAVDAAYSWIFIVQHAHRWLILVQCGNPSRFGRNRHRWRKCCPPGFKRH